MVKNTTLNKQIKIVLVTRPGTHKRLLKPETALKKVNDMHMTLTFEPYVLIIWQDPRLSIRNVSRYQMLPTSTTKEIWVPTLAISGLMTDSIIIC